MLPCAYRTWIVMLHGQNASVFESDCPGSCITRLRTFAAAPAREDVQSPPGRMGALAQYLEHACDEKQLERLVLVGAAEPVEDLLGLLPAATHALVVAKQFEDLSDVPPEELRWHVPASAAI